MQVLIISGASGSGKSTIVDLLKSSFHKSGLATLVVSMDWYYRSMTPGEPVDWDNISAIDVDLLYEHLHRIKMGDTITLPGYDYVTHQRIPEAHDSGKPDILILEGIFALYDAKIRELADLKIYVDADPIKTCLKRRIKRDIADRGRSAESVIDQYFAQVLPGYEKFVAPGKCHADLCYVNENTLPTESTLFIKIVETYVRSATGTPLRGSS